MNDQIDKLQLNGSFASHIQYRNKPTIQPISSLDDRCAAVHSSNGFHNAFDSCTSANCPSANHIADRTANGDEFVKSSKLFDSTTIDNQPLKLSEDDFGRNLNHHNQFNGDLNPLNSTAPNRRNLSTLTAANDQNAQYKKSLPDLINGPSGHFNRTNRQAPNIRLNTNPNGNSTGSKGQPSADDRALPESDFERIDESIFMADSHRSLPPNGSSTFNASLASITSQHNLTSPSSQPSGAAPMAGAAPKLPVKSQSTINYCNIAQIVETSECNQISIDLSAPSLPPKLPPKKQSSATLLINRKIDFNQLSDLKFDSHLNQKLSQHLNQQFDQHDQMHQQSNPVNNQPNSQSFNQFSHSNHLNHLNSQLTSVNSHTAIQPHAAIQPSGSQALNGQSPKKALLVCSNSILNEQKARQTRSAENIKFRSNSLSSADSSTSFQTGGRLDQAANEFANHEPQRKHHSDNEVIKDFLQINKNINELGMNRNVNSMVNGSAIGTAIANGSVSMNNEMNIELGMNGGMSNGMTPQLINSTASSLDQSDQQIVFRRKKQSSISEQTCSIVQLNEIQLNQYLNSNDKNATASGSQVKCDESQSGSRPSSQYDNLSLSELCEPNQPVSSFSTPPPLSTGSHLAQTHGAQNSLNLSWQSNNFSSTVSSSSSSNCHMDGNLEHLHSNGSSNRSSDRSIKYSAGRTSRQLDNQSQSSYENEDDLPPPLPISAQAGQCPIPGEP